MAEFFSPIPLPVVFGGVMLAVLVILISCAPHKWVERMADVYHRRNRRR